MDEAILRILRQDPQATLTVERLLSSTKDVDIMTVRRDIVVWNRWANEQLSRRGKGKVGLGPDLLTHFLPNATPSRLSLGLFVDSYLRVLLGSLIRDIEQPVLNVVQHEFPQIGAALEELSRAKLVLLDLAANQFYINSFMFSGRMVPIRLVPQAEAEESSEWDHLGI
jgi:hypothetical protein